MSRTPLFDHLRRLVRAAEVAHRHHLPADEVVPLLEARARLSRRGFLTGAAAVAAAGLLPRAGGARPARRSSAEVAIVGAGMAGLACGYQLASAGVRATLYEAAPRVGGRIYSLGGEFSGPVSFPGQVVERGGELIDTTHTTLSGFIQTFQLEVEDLARLPGETRWHLDGALRDEAEIVEEFRAFVPRMQADLRASSGGPTADAHNEADEVLDYTTLAEYLATRGAGPVLTAALDSAYVGEYGVEIDQQSCLAFLYFIHADRRSKFKEFGIFSDERYHVRGGNEQITRRIAETLEGQIELGMRLVALARSATGRYRLTFDRGGGRLVTREADAVVLTLPFSTLRQVHLDASLELPPGKVRAIDEFVYGTNAKTMVGFDRRVWQDVGGSGLAYVRGLPQAQVVWETNPLDGAPRGVLTDYAGGRRGAALRTDRVQAQVAAWLADAERIFPGAQAAATRSGGRYLAHLEHWPSSPFVLGSYTANAPGYFTTLAGEEGKRVGNLLFAGEHADSFYDWQGFMEGAAASGVRAGTELVHQIRNGTL